MIVRDYICYLCGEEQTNHSLELYSFLNNTEGAFVCKCGGEFKPKTTQFSSNFEPHYSPEIGDMVYSWKDAEDKGKKFRSPQHPNGFILTQSNRKFLDEMKYIRKHKEEYIQECYSKGEMKRDGTRSSGIKYKPGSNTHFDAQNSRFIPRSR